MLSLCASKPSFLADPCLQNPCFSGVACTFTSIAPFYTCGPCPAGYTGDGETCVGLQVTSTIQFLVLTA